MKLFGNRPSGGEHTSANSETDISVTEIRSDERKDGAEAAALPAKKNVRRRVLIIVAVVVLAALMAGGYFWFFYPRAPRRAEQGQTPVGTQETANPVGSARPDATKAPTNATPAPNGAVDDPDPEETMPPGAAPDPVEADTRDGVYTILAAGFDQVNRLTDTLIVATFDTKAHTIECVNIPRDTLINVAYTSPKKINTVYAASYGNRNYTTVDEKNEYATGRLREQIRNLTGFYVDCYIVVDLQAVTDIVDAMGGVVYDVKQDLYYNDPTQDLHIDIKAGEQRLSGEDAVKMLRFRSGYGNADLGRISVQQDFLMTMARQLISAKNIPALPEIINIMTENTLTNLTAENIFYFAQRLLECSTDGIRFQTMPIVGNTINGISFVAPSVNSWLEMINGSINPFEKDITLSNVSLLSFSGGGVYATNGYIAGGADSFYCLECSGIAGTMVAHAANGAHTFTRETPAPADEPSPETQAPENGGEAQTTEPEPPAPENGESGTAEPEPGGETQVTAPESGETGTSENGGETEG